MTQRRYWNYRDPDATREINRWLLGILPKGLYFGFDAVLDGTLNLTLNHATTGQIETKSDNTLSSKIGKYILPHGVVISEDADIVIPMSAGDVSDDRIDLIIVTLEYVEVIGGSAAQYSVIQGVPGGGTPALPFPEKQMIIGTVLVPAGSTMTTDFTYTRPAQPLLGNHPDNFAYLDRNQIWEHTQAFKDLNYERWWVGSYVGTTLTLNAQGNCTATIATGSLATITARPNATPLKVYFAFNCTLTTAGNLKLPGNVSYPIVGGDVAEFVYYTSLGWLMTVPPVSDMVRKSTTNKLTKTLTLNAGTATISGSNIVLGNDGNIFYVPNIASGQVNLITTQPDETEILLRFTNTVKIMNAAGPTTGFSNILCSYGLPMIILAGETLRLYSRSGQWRPEGYTYQRMFVKTTKIAN